MAWSVRVEIWVVLEVDVGVESSLASRCSLLRHFLHMEGSVILYPSIPRILAPKIECTESEFRSAHQLSLTLRAHWAPFHSIWAEDFDAMLIAHFVQRAEGIKPLYLRGVHCVLSFQSRIPHGQKQLDAMLIAHFPREPRTSISICAAHTVCILLHEHSLWAGSLNEMLVAHFSLRTESLACLNRSAHWAFLTELLLERGIARESCCWVATPASSVEDNSLPCKIGEHLSALTCATSRNYEAWNHLRFLGHINHYMYMYRNELGVTPCFGAFDCRTKLAFKSPATLKNATMLRSAKTLSPSNGYSDEGAWRKVVSREIARL